LVFLNCLCRIPRFFIGNRAKTAFQHILGTVLVTAASDEQFEKIAELAKSAGFDITAEDIKNYLTGNGEMDADLLDKVAGGNDDYLRGEYEPIYNPNV